MKHHQYLQSLFDDITNDPMLFLDVPQDGCFYRAFKIADSLFANCLTTLILQIGNRPKRCETNIAQKYSFHLTQKANNGLTDNDIIFYRHVAAGIKYGKKILVFDPVLFDGPVDTRQWASTTKYCITDNRNGKILHRRPISANDISKKEYDRESYIKENCLDIFDPFYFFMSKKFSHSNGAGGINIPEKSEFIQKQSPVRQLHIPFHLAGKVYE